MIDKSMVVMSVINMFMIVKSVIDKSMMNKSIAVNGCDGEICDAPLK